MSSDAPSFTGPRNAAIDRVPPHVFFVVSAVFHYLGPACAVLLFARIEPLGVMWLRIASAAAIFALWRRPWRVFARLAVRDRWTVLWLGIVLAAMNGCFYIAISLLPLSTVGAIEFLGPIGLAAYGMRSRRNLQALALAVAGVALLTEIRVAGTPLGYVFAFANCALFVLYIVLGHRIAQSGSATSGAREGGGISSIDRLGAAMLVAMLAGLPIGFREALPAFSDPVLLAAGIGVGLASSVIPYVCDQLAMARLSRAGFALLLSLLPATACIIGIVVLGQVPSHIELTGIALVIVGVALHRPEPV